MTDRFNNLVELLNLVETVPTEWAEEAKKEAAARTEIQPLPCSSWLQLREAWVAALKWRQGLEDVLLAMMAVALSTEQEGDQLFLQVIGEPGTGKTRLCDAMLVSKSCYPLEHLTGFHSGYQGSEGEHSDYSLIARINRKTLITPEGDVLMSSPKFVEIMSQQRRIFDGTSGASYKNRKVDMRYTGLRTPWIIAGTPALMESDQSRLGDRFLRVCVDRPGITEERDILRRVVANAMRSVKRTSNCSPDTQLAPELAKAYRLTGGYVDHLRTAGAAMLGQLVNDDDEVASQCIDLAQFTAYLRARPNPDPRKQDVEASRELPSRLAHQFARLASCLAVVTQKKSVDSEVMRIVRKVAVDTARGKMLTLVGLMFERGRVDGCYAASLARLTGASDEKMADTLKFLLEIGAVENFHASGPGSDAYVRWRLSHRLDELWRTVHGL